MDVFKTQSMVFLVVLNLFLVASSSQAVAKPKIALNVMPSEGVAPLDVELRFQVVEADDPWLRCKLRYFRGSEGVTPVIDLEEASYFQDELSFFLEPPYPQEIVFHHTYQALDFMYQPEVECVGPSGRDVQSGEVRVLDLPGNQKPVIELTADASLDNPMVATSPVEFTLEVSDPDGDSLECEIYSGSSILEVETLPTLPSGGSATTFFSYRSPSYSSLGYKAVARCLDEKGSTALAAFSVQVFATPGNTPPNFNFGLSNPNGFCPHAVTPLITGISDPDGDVLQCYFFYLSDKERVNFVLEPNIVNNVPVYENTSVDYTFTQPFSGSARVVCDDGNGNIASEIRQMNVEEAPGNRSPLITINPVEESNNESGQVVRFDFTVFDADENTLRCEWMRGIPGEEPLTFDVVAPYDDLPTLRHTYTKRNSYPARIQCADDFGGSGGATAVVVVDDSIVTDPVEEGDDNNSGVDESQDIEDVDAETNFEATRVGNGGASGGGCRASSNRPEQNPFWLVLLAIVGLLACHRQAREK